MDGYFLGLKNFELNINDFESQIIYHNIYHNIIGGQLKMQKNTYLIIGSKSNDDPEIFF